MERKKRVPAADIKQFIIHSVEEHPRDIVAITAKRFKITRPTAHNHVRALLEDGSLKASGRTKAREYELAVLVDELFVVEAAPGFHEDEVWREQVLPLLGSQKENVLDICNYGVTEMLNNVADHSGAQQAGIKIVRTAAKIEIRVMDRGVGIFKKLVEELHLSDPRHALLELSKGKLTTDKERHTGEGIFFTSRMFDEFRLFSKPLAYIRTNRDDDWLIDVDERELELGTGIIMAISTDSERKAQMIFDKYSSGDPDYGFSKTHVPIELARYEGERLISRSQAKRLLARVDRFEEVLFDFRGVESVGQAFSDEIFRVFQNAHPGIRIIAVNANKEVGKMIRRARSNEGGDPGKLKVD